jgi:hypothetical protein
MNENLTQYPMSKDQLQGPNRTLRILSIPILVLWVIDVMAGSSWAFGYSVGIAAVHVIAALLMVGITAIAFIISLRFPSRRNRLSAAISLVSTVGAAVAGAVYVFADKNRTALVTMEVLTLFILIGALMMLIWGSVARPNS